MASSESYLRQGQKHVAKDKVVDWETVEKSQKVNKGHLWTLNQVFNPGQDHGERSEVRTREAKQMANLVLPSIYLLAKDHKNLKRMVTQRPGLCVLPQRQ